jgi:hypothetical protein
MIVRKWKESLMADLLTEPVYMALVASTYTYSDSHEFLEDVLSSLALNDTDGTLLTEITNKSITNGRFTTSDNYDTFTDVKASATVYDRLLFFMMVTDETDSPMLALLPLPGGGITPTGGDITMVWDKITSMNGQTGGLFAL